jgi:glycosyltransferase involved in cell wall biosynthesis
MEGKIIAFPHRASNKGGPSSFQERLIKELEKKAFKIVYPEDKIIPNTIVVNGGTKKIIWLIMMKIKGVKIIHRMDGIGWIHKYQDLTILQRLRAELRNIQLKFIRNYLADYVIYQSNFVEKWIINKLGKIKTKSCVIYNGVDLNIFKPISNNIEKKNIICVEGYFDYSPYVTKLLNIFYERIKFNSKFNNLILYGLFYWKSNELLISEEIHNYGFIDRKIVNSVYKNAILLSLDLNPACPNTVIEALASGIPVIGYDTGALKELVPPEAGEIVPYGGDPWKLDFPDISNLINAANKILNNWQNYSYNARKIAEKRFSINEMAEKYICIINK